MYQRVEAYARLLAMMVVGLTDTQKPSGINTAIVQILSMSFQIRTQLTTSRAITFFDASKTIWLQLTRTRRKITLRTIEQNRKDEFELEKLRIQLGADTSKESDIKFLVKEVSKFIHRSDLKEDISLYLKLFERQAQRLNIDQENWVSHLLGLLPTEVSHIIAREPDDKANSYEHIKDLLLKRFKLTPEKFRQLFVTHQKAPERTWIDFYHELNTYFNGWIDGLKIDTFKKLSDLIITDQLKRKTPFEFKEYYLDEWANMNSPVQLAEKLEEFEDFKRTLK
ncbi:uncharacterized protein TNCV_228681 [Trichonephila clavipes]|nr:uncharacterized protein TNCV_228681 [Trichonephila clavipes]